MSPSSCCGANIARQSQEPKSDPIANANTLVVQLQRINGEGACSKNKSNQTATINSI